MISAALDGVASSCPQSAPTRLAGAASCIGVT